MARADITNTMKARRILGLRAQILLGLAVVTLLAVTTTSYIALWAASGTLREQRESTAIALAAVAAGACSAVVDPATPLEAEGNRARLRAAVSSIAEPGLERQVSVYASDRRVLIARPPRPPTDRDPPLLLAVMSGVAPVYQYRSRPGDGEMELCAYAPVAGRGPRNGAVRVCVPAPAPMKAVLAGSGWLVALAVADAALILALGFFVLTRLVVQPMQEMQRATTAVSTGDWDQRIVPSGPREVAALGAAFNEMTSSLARQREQLIRSEKLASVGQLAAGVAHEIGNPLAAVLGLVDILRVGIASGAPMDPGESKDTLDRVQAETQRMHRIISDLLEYSRPTREEAQPTDPLKVLRTASALLAPQARFRDVKLHVDPDGESWPQVLVSPGRLTQVFVNLMLNAADAMHGAGELRATCSAPDNGRVAVRFADHGPGVPADLQRKIFDPFFTTKDPGRGTGLGLSISRSITETYGGALELGESAPGAPGATFIVTLPVA